MGKYGCDQPELGLRLGCGSASEGSEYSSIGRPIRCEEYWHANGNGNVLQQHHLRRQQQQQQNIAIFCNGRICVCDVTEIQARAILCIARREMEERIMERSNHQRGDGQRRSRPPPVPAMGPQLINPELSMKRSLQRFLQKRKTRMDASAPYSYAPDTPSPLSSS